jgi:phospholipase/carboxylesterase
VPADTGRAWFDAGPLGPARESVIGAVEGLHAVMDELCATRDLDRQRVVVAGFSQGGATALALALSDVGGPRPVGVGCLSGFLPDVVGHEYDWAGASGTAVLVQHGTHDDVVPFDLGRDTAAVLAMHGVPVVLRSYDMGHETTPSSRADARAWLARLHAGEAPREPVTDSS